MATLVFDIETTAQPMENFDEAQQEYLFRDAERLPDPAAREARRAEIERWFSLWPLTGHVVCVAMVNADTSRGQVLFTADGPLEEQSEAVRFVAVAEEADLLAGFWEIARHYDSVVTFNGRNFDIPFMYLRSALLQVPISRKDWLGYRFSHAPHCDLADQLSFYGSGREGATRRFNLDFYCKAFGITSPKEGGVTGVDVGQLIQAGRYREVAEYCLRDVHATALLYQIWRERLAGVK